MLIGKEILIISYTEKVCKTLIYIRGVKTVIFQPGLDDNNKIIQGKMYATFFKMAQKNEVAIFVVPENEESDDSSVTTKVETF